MQTGVRRSARTGFVLCTVFRPELLELFLHFGLGSGLQAIADGGFRAILYEIPFQLCQVALLVEAIGIAVERVTLGVGGEAIQEADLPVGNDAFALREIDAVVGLVS